MSQRPNVKCPHCGNVFEDNKDDDAETLFKKYLYSADDGSGLPPISDVFGASDMLSNVFGVEAPTVDCPQCKKQFRP